MDEQRLSQSTNHSATRRSGGPHFDPRTMPQESAVVSQPVRTGYFCKRPCDLLLSGLALVSLSPVFLVISLLIKLTSPGPVFFRQQRLGLNEQPFTILKFRSMRAGSDKTGAQFTSANDNRITGIGKLIRKTSLDELPQLINIFRGEMSLIGPRPYIGFELEQATLEERRKRASVRPGVSGLAQVSGRSQLTQQAVIDFDLQYVAQCSFKFDVQILIQTIRKVIRCEGTN
ncbi:sugar transferase [Gimesia panareensis]|uniref:UDP-glucose:undecaprenyl-phosphate glucose-1-phosphate transferase n=1 Tax=Gimesia panareensis TaxID=2527978 RepID=A0A517Q848_9PLAN|nr:sugar transferase [Gimesia panareensis]QDT27802.1 UDP-glucose:undecaprenyl-phosphate glucose-1-phosphate transferase [Gimesia panareensis]QDU49378.1 UDP-glucose:undecaprenyl-phosphate glucose-1-phosphate transferase [Gimesia panareensis]